MILKKGLRPSFKRGLGLVGLGSSMLFGTAALAGGISIVYVSLNMPNSMMASWLVRPLAAAGVITVGGSASVPVTIGSTQSFSTTSPTPTPAASPSPTVTPGVIPATKIGVNLGKLTYWNKTRYYSNLLAGSSWGMLKAWKGATFQGDQVDSNGNVVKLAADEVAQIQLIKPAITYSGKSVDVVCRWTGEGKLAFQPGAAMRNPSYTANSARFTYMPGDARTILQINSVNAANPIKGLDCREADADPKALFDPAFLAYARKYNTLRYMWWQEIPGNKPVTWATRTKPTLIYKKGTDGPAIEDMIELANLTKTNPWFAMPWNADEAYYRGFAQLVRDKLDPSLKVYVEVSNEIWNTAMPATAQAIQEGKDRGFPTSYALSYRLAEKTGEVMDVWSSVYAGQMNRLVRVVATQHGSSRLGNEMLGFRDTAKKVDAIATAPYILFFFNSSEVYNKDDLTSVFATLKTRLDEAGKNMQVMKAVADKYKIRYIGYEGGQHAMGADVATNVKLQRDARMGQFFWSYLDKWRTNAGDLVTLFEDVDGAPGTWGAFGMQEYAGQPLTEAPKANAVHLFVASINNR